MSGSRLGRRDLAAKWGSVAHREHVLSNGLSVLCVPGAGGSRAVITLLVRVGSRFETPESNGLSHFLEHMLYRGCRSKKTAHDQAFAFEELGASLYGATQSDYGTMALTLPPESFEEAVALFAEVILEPRFSAIEIERGIVREEILEDLDDTGRQIDADNLARSLIYKTHPLGFTITGSIDTVARFDREMLVQHHATHYTGANGVLCFAGAIDPDRCLAAAEEHFAAIPKGQWIDTIPPPFRQSRARVQHVHNSSSQTTVRVAFRAVSEHDPREPAVEMLLRILDDGMSTRLYERICDAQGLCYDVSALFEAYEDDGVFDVAAEVRHDRTSQVIGEIFGIVSDLALHGPDERELAKAKARHFWQMRAMLDDPEATAGFYALASLAKIAGTPMARHAELEQVTCEQVREAARIVFRPERMSVVTVGALDKAQERALRQQVQDFRPEAK